MLLAAFDRNKGRDRLPGPNYQFGDLGTSDLVLRHHPCLQQALATGFHREGFGKSPHLPLAFDHRYPAHLHFERRGDLSQALREIKRPDSRQLLRLNLQRLRDLDPFRDPLQL
ncbi:MAG: hypothetical protein ACK56I_02100 [bacterium]